MPTLRAWRLSADSIVDNHDYGATAQEISEWFQVPVADVETLWRMPREHANSLKRFLFESEEREVGRMTDIDWSECPIVERDPEKMGGVPTLRAWRLSADSIVENHDDGISAEEIAEMFGVALADVEALIAYAARARHYADANLV